MKGNLINFNSPQRIVFGIGAFDKIKDELLYLNARKVLILHDRFIAEKIIDLTQDDGFEFICFSSFDGEPSISVVNECLEISKKFDADVCIGVGGGSVLDVAKLVAWAKGNNCEIISDNSLINNFNKPAIPMIMVPTTSGTGSEATHISVLLDADKNKWAVISRHLIPHIAYIDPSLTLTIPKALTALTGIDALSHCVENFINPKGSIWSDQIALQGAVSVYSHLKSAVEDGNNVQAREYLSLASFFGGVANANAGGNCVHALAYPLAGFNISHSQGIALLYPAVINHLINRNVAKLNRICFGLGVAENSMSPDNLFNTLIKPIVDIISQTDNPQNLTDIGIDESHLDFLCQQALKQERLLNNSPVKFTKAQIDSIYRVALDNAF